MIISLTSVSRTRLWAGVLSDSAHHGISGGQCRAGTVNTYGRKGREGAGRGGRGGDNRGEAGKRVTLPSLPNSHMNGLV